MKPIIKSKVLFQMLYDDDNYLNGLESLVMKGYDFIPYPNPNGEFYLFHPLTTLGCFKDSAEAKCNRPLPPHYEIFKAWHYGKKDCNINNKDIDIYPDNECLNKRFGRSVESVGGWKCNSYYIWEGLEVKSRSCMIKNAKLEEIDLYQICGTDEAFLCTKSSVIKKEVRREAAINRNKEIYDDITAKKEAAKLYFTDPQNIATNEWVANINRMFYSNSY